MVSETVFEYIFDSFAISRFIYLLSLSIKLGERRIGQVWLGELNTRRALVGRWGGMRRALAAGIGSERRAGGGGSGVKGGIRLEMRQTGAQTNCARAGAENMLWAQANEAREGQCAAVATVDGEFAPMELPWGQNWARRRLGQG